jgi:NAD(P)H-flavin reductase
MTNATSHTPDKSANHDSDFNYQLLARLQQDCEYYLGYGNRVKKHLWALDEAEQIKKMKELYEGFREKPEWISLGDIEKYEAAMIGK